MHTHIKLLTKKYIIDYLNALCFGETLTWDGVDQYNSMVLLSSEDDADVHTEQRGALFVHKKFPMALRLLVTAVEGLQQKICYRITGIEEKISIDDPRKIVYPTDFLTVDYSVSDLNLGIQDVSSYSFCSNVKKDEASMFKLLSFIIDSAFVVKDDFKVYKNLLNEHLSYPPLSDDIHYSPLFGV